MRPTASRRQFLSATAASLAGLGLAGRLAPRAFGAEGQPERPPFELRFRQIHLDFHTSQHIPDVGAAFDPEEFAATLSRARVDSVTCFGRCHHGYIYYDTKAFPERRHPHLKRNLLRRADRGLPPHGTSACPST